MALENQFNGFDLVQRLRKLVTVQLKITPPLKLENGASQITCFYFSEISANS